MARVTGRRTKYFTSMFKLQRVAHRRVIVVNIDECSHHGPFTASSQAMGE